MERHKNIASTPWIPIGWHHEKMMEGLTQLQKRADEQALDAIRWYYEKKKSKNHWSRFLRFLAIMFTVLGGLVPILATTGIVPALLRASGYNADDRGTQLAELHFNQFGYVFIGLAAGCVAFDRFFGFSTNWMRYIAAAMRIETDRTRFQFEWELLVAPLRGGEPSKERVEELLRAIEKFSLGIRESIELEAGAWIAEFQTNLAQLDKETKELFESARNERRTIADQAEARRAEATGQTGTVELRITNFSALSCGWSVAVDNSSPVADITTEAFVLEPLRPGKHRILARGRVNESEVHASEPVEVEAGKLSRISLLLD